jgi:hypothetical protein
MCEGEEESANDVFLHCEFAMKVWDIVMRWVGMIFLIPPNLFLLWESWEDASGYKKILNGFQMIWHAVVWGIWRARNDRVFNNKIGEVED